MSEAIQLKGHEWDAAHLMIRDSDILNLFTLIRSGIRACQHTLDGPGPWPGDEAEAPAPLSRVVPQISRIAFQDLRDLQHYYRY